MGQYRLICHTAVVAAANDLVLIDDNAADGDIPQSSRLFRLAYGFFHVADVLR